MLEIKLWAHKISYQQQFVFHFVSLTKYCPLYTVVLRDVNIPSDMTLMARRNKSVNVEFLLLGDEDEDAAVCSETSEHNLHVGVSPERQNTALTTRRKFEIRNCKKIPLIFGPP